MSTEGCERCSGTVEDATWTAIEELRGETVLNGVEGALAQAAVTLARAIDKNEDGGRQLAAQTRELRATLKQLADQMPAQDPDAEEDTGPA